MSIKVALQPKQSELLRLVEGTDYTMIGYGGSNGGGKSDGIRSVNMLLCLEKKPYPIKTLIFRRKSNDLLENHIIPFFQRYPELEKLFNKTERIIYWPDGSTTKFGSADNETDIYDFEGKEYDYIFVDEATHCTQMMIEFLKSRNRSPNYTAKMIFTMIPGFVGHNYFKRLFIKKEYLDYEESSHYVFLPARVWDNVVWCEDQLSLRGYTVDQYYNEWNEDRRKSFTLQYSDYAQNLAHLPDQKKKARLFGDWDIFEGMFFEEFNSEVHIIKRQDYLTYGELLNFNVAGGKDYGNVTVTEWMARDFNGNYILFDELYQENMNRSKKIEQELEFNKYRGLSNRYIIADTNMWIKDAFDVDSTTMPANDYIQAGVKIIPVSKQSTDKNKGFRANCNDNVKDVLHYELTNGIITTKPKLLIYERCYKFLETFPSLIVDPNNPEDIADGQEDHCYDAMKHVFMWLRRPKEAKKEEPRSSHAPTVKNKNKLSDPSLRM